MQNINTYEIQFTTAVEFYKEKLQPCNERTKQVFAENESQAVDRAYQKLMRDFPDSSKDIWEVKNIVKRVDNILYPSPATIKNIYFQENDTSL